MIVESWWFIYHKVFTLVTSKMLHAEQLLNIAGLVTTMLDMCIHTLWLLWGSSMWTYETWIFHLVVFDVFMFMGICMSSLHISSTRCLFLCITKITWACHSCYWPLDDAVQWLSSGLVNSLKTWLWSILLFSWLYYTRSVATIGCRQRTRP